MYFLSRLRKYIQPHPITLASGIISIVQKNEMPGFRRVECSIGSVLIPEEWRDAQGGIWINPITVLVDLYPRFDSKGSDSTVDAYIEDANLLLHPRRLQFSRRKDRLLRVFDPGGQAHAHPAELSMIRCGKYSGYLIQGIGCWNFVSPGAVRIPGRPARTEGPAAVYLLYTGQNCYQFNCIGGTDSSLQELRLTMDVFMGSLQLREL